MSQAGLFSVGSLQQIIRDQTGDDGLLQCGLSKVPGSGSIFRPFNLPMSLTVLSISAYIKQSTQTLELLLYL